MQQLVEFAGNHLILVSALIVVGAALVFTSLRGNKNKILPSDATTLINREDAVVVDVRSAAEFTKGHIINAISIPSNGFKDQLNLLEKHRDKPIIVYCSSGAQSSQACSTLTKEGFEKVHDLKGGMMSWLNAGLPATRK